MRRTPVRSTAEEASDEVPDDRPDPGADSQCLIELEYDAVEEHSSHESWLIEWVLECIDVDDIVAIALSRNDVRSFSISIHTQSPCPANDLGDRYRLQLVELAKRVDGLSIHCYDDASTEYATG